MIDKKRYLLHNLYQKDWHDLHTIVKKQDINVLCYMDSGIFVEMGHSEFLNLQESYPGLGIQEELFSPTQIR
jgi:hypothetical protein